MAYTALKQEGINFIRNVCKNQGNKLLSGKVSDGPLPYCNPPTSPDKIWYAHPKDDSGVLITTSIALGEALIKWFNKYSEQYELNANIIAAQAYAESGYILWNYPLTSSASGISQFVNDAVYDIIIRNQDKTFSTDEISAITKDFTQHIPIAPKVTIGKKNKPYLHQNICDNPQIMIKAQCSYMKIIANRCDGIASSSLFGYNRGPEYSFPSYTKSITSASNHKSGYEEEGINYVYRIFNILGNPKYNKNGYFGLDELNLNEPFNEFNAEIAISNLS